MAEAISINEETFCACVGLVYIKRHQVLRMTGAGKDSDS